MPLRKFENDFPAATAALRNAAKNGRLAHAYLLHCDDPALAADFAAAIAQASACPARLPDGDACGKCEVCAKIERGVYPDLFILEPTSKSRRIKIGKDQNEPDTIRWYQSIFYLKGSSGAGRKAGIILDADCMMPQAQNAFLKTLEEPPPSTVFILCTSNPLGLLTTVRSRCQKITILRNSRKYDFAGCGDLIGSLRNLLSGDGDRLQRAEKCSQSILDISGGLRNSSEEKTREKWRKILEQSAAAENTARESAEERFDAAVQADYLLARESMISAIHSFFAQAYQLSKGVARDSLQSPELMAGVEIDGGKAAEIEAYANLSAAEEFTGNLRWNVDEALAVRCLCFSIAFPEHAVSQPPRSGKYRRR